MEHAAPGTAPACLRVHPMPRIEDYALIGDLQTAALVSREGSMDWCCFPRFDSGACFAALLGEPHHGRWLLAPVTRVRRSYRRYRTDTLILESVFETDEGTVRGEPERRRRSRRLRGQPPAAAALARLGRPEAPIRRPRGRPRPRIPGATGELDGSSRLSQTRAVSN